MYNKLEVRRLRKLIKEKYAYDSIAFIKYFNGLFMFHVTSKNGCGYPCCDIDDNIIVDLQGNLIPSTKPL